MTRAATLVRPSALRGVIRELRWQRTAELPAPSPTWELPNAGAVTLTWPERYHRPDQAAWVEPLRLGFEQVVRIERAPLQPERQRLAPHIVPFSVELGGRRIDAAVDYGDEPRLRPGLADAFDLVFKMQYLAEGYGTERVVPGGFVANGMSLYRYLPRLRATADTAAPFADVYGRFGPDKAPDLRERAVELLTAQDELAFRGGIGRVRYLQSLIEAARSRTCLDLPGNGPLCFRLVEYLAVGSAIVSPPPTGRLHVPLEEGRHVVFCRPDLSDIVDVVADVARDDELLSSLRRETRAYFDRFLDYRQLARYYVATCLERL